MKIAITLLLAAIACTSQAKTLWSDYSLTLLRGYNYKVGDANRTVATFEYATGTSWGDSFMFFDRLESDNGDGETYGEWSPRLKLHDFGEQFVSNLYLAGTVEIDSFSTNSGFGNSFTNYLAGVGVDLKIPHFNYFQANVYRRFNDQDNNNYQLTLVWGVPIGPLYYDGFLDYSSSTDIAKPSFNLTSQLKYDIGPALGLDSKLYVGIEYAFWQNKFGIDGMNEHNANLLLKYHF